MFSLISVSVLAVIVVIPAIAIVAGLVFNARRARSNRIAANAFMRAESAYLAAGIPPRRASELALSSRAVVRHSA